MKKTTIQSFDEQFSLLKFDTKIFGFKVAKILLPTLTLAELRSILNTLKKQHVHLVYWQARGGDKKSKQAAKRLKGFLCCEQVTYLRNLKKIVSLPKTAPRVTTYLAKNPSNTMKQLAIQIGICSRFGIDFKISRKLMKKLYHAWIKNSVKMVAADKVLVIRIRNRIVGMTTLSNKNHRGDIRLLAVDPKCRGKKLGTKLVYAALKYFNQKGYSKAQVVTQKTNLPACSLYEKCGFRRKRVDNFFHFWL